MTTYQVAWNPTTRVVKIQMDGDAPGSGFTDIGSFDHDYDPDDSLGWNDNHVLYHHVRDLLYKVNPSVQDMQRVSIEVVKVTGISVTPATASLANAATQQLTTTFTPANASNRALKYTTSNADIATVSATGLVTAGATDGVATITVESVDGGFKDTCEVTVA